MNLFNSAGLGSVSIKHGYIALMYGLRFSGYKYSNVSLQRRASIKSYARVGVGPQS
jgi:hypothetical protein